MVVQDKIRSSLYTQLEQAFGSDEAGLLMEALPPHGWSSLVTNDHLDARLAQVDARFDVVEGRLATMVTKTEFVDRIRQLDEHLSGQMVTKDQFSAGLAQLGEAFHRDLVRLLLAALALMVPLCGVLVAVALHR